MMHLSWKAEYFLIIYSRNRGSWMKEKKMILWRGMMLIKIRIQCRTSDGIMELCDCLCHICLCHRAMWCMDKKSWGERRWRVGGSQGNELRFLVQSYWFGINDHLMLIPTWTLEWCPSGQILTCDWVGLTSGYIIFSFRCTDHFDWCLFSLRFFKHLISSCNPNYIYGIFLNYQGYQFVNEYYWLYY